MERDNRGYLDGRKKGYEQGYLAGLMQGKQHGREQYRERIDGTSIIIPTHNKRDYLAECVESIFAHTVPPFELIVVDNASDDGTGEYLAKMSDRIRIVRNEKNLGFAGAVNQGLMKARGTTLLVLNNDAVVTSNWLDNLLTCLRQYPKAGIVGPVTNYISGTQLVNVTYGSLQEMHRYAASHNRSDPSRWTPTERLTGFCMLMRREVFEALGYFDEGFEIGNCEDDDYVFRARLLGFELVVARDTFIHHYGSVSMGALESFERIYRQNLRYYAEKWEGVPPRTPWHETATGKMSDLYPTEVAVKGAGESVYWISGGQKYRIDDPEGLDAVRLSQTDIRQWPSGGVMSRREVEARLAELARGAGDGSLLPGMIARAKNGELYQYDAGAFRKIANDWTCRCWRLDRREPSAMPDPPFPEAPPIVAPIRIQSGNI